MSTFQVIDSHLHLWDPATGWYDWMIGEFAALAKPVDHDDAQAELAEHSIGTAVVVQGCTRIEETQMLLASAEGSDFARAIVGWTDLTDPGVTDVIEALADGPGGRFLVGFRHPGLFESDDNWIRRPEVVRGIAAVGASGRCFDLLVTPGQLAAATEVVRLLPSVTFVLNHIGEPPIAQAQFQPWARAITQLAAEPNVFCKVSGMVTQADWSHWLVADLRPYADHILDEFSPSRLMYGSDWPYCTLAASYSEQLTAATTLLSDLSPSERAMIMGGTAATVYLARTRC